MRALVFVYIIEQVAQAHAQNTPLLVNTCARSRAEAIERDLLVAYPLIIFMPIHATLQFLKGSIFEVLDRN